jgi:hypothetical protein
VTVSARSLLVAGMAFWLAATGCGGDGDPTPGPGAGGTGGIGGSGGSGGYGGDGGTGGSGGIVSPEEICNNGTDDDGDGDADCADPDCAEHRACLCGNGVLDPGEACDGTELGGKDCASQGFDGGVLACTDGCELDVSGCTHDEVCDNGTDDDGDGDADCADADCAAFEACLCGNGVLDSGEECDGAAFGGKTCESLGYASGILACTNACELNESGCVYPPEDCDNGTDDDHDGDADCDDGDCAEAAVCLCGNGVLDDGENCDGTELGEASCRTLDFEAGDLACNDDCTFDTSDCRLVEDCADGQDDDGDGDVDCQDSECQEAPNCNVCGDDRADPGEACDGTDLKGQTCETKGFAGGTLACVGCAFDTSGCHEAEACNGGADEDRDGLVDCDDPDCASHANCIPGAFCHTAIEADGQDAGQLAGATANFAGSCAGPGKDKVYVFTPGVPGELGNLHLELASSGNLAFYVRAACDEAASEVVCVDDVPDHSAPETADLMVQGGVPLFVIVDSPEAATSYNYELRLSFDACGNGHVTGYEECDPPDGVLCNENCLFVEDDCTDLVDDDRDGWVDCQDPTGCGSDPVCVPGTAAAGSPCTVPSDCASVAGHGPICFGEATVGYPSGMCSEGCDLAHPDCPAGSACVDVRWGNGRGACFATCTTAADCARPGYACESPVAGAATVCVPDCTAHAQCGTTGHCDLFRGLCSWVEDCDNGADDDRDGLADCDDPDCAGETGCLPPEADCGNFLDDDHDGAVDCRDETGCGATAACTPGMGVVGAACTAASDCASSVGDDPACLTTPFAGGYCTELCDLGGADCPAGTACVEPGLVLGQSLPATVGVCMNECTTAADCGTGWTCVELDPAAPALCVPVESCGNGVDDDLDLLADCADPDCATAPACLPSPAETEPNDTPATADVWVAGWEGELGGSDVDWILFTVPASASTVTVSTVDSGSYHCWYNNIDSELWIYAADGTTEVGYNDDLHFDCFCSEVVLSHPPAGTYYAKVRSLFGASFDYGLDVVIR